MPAAIKSKSKKPAPRKRGRPFADFSARNEIVMGAATAFGAKGYADTSVEDICQASKVARSTFYSFYKGKDDVFSALLDLATTALVQAVRMAILSADTTPAKLDAALEAYLRAQAYAGPLASVLVHAATGPNPVGVARRKKSVGEFIELFRDGIGTQAPQDELIYKGLLAALETVSLDLMSQGPMDEEKIERGKSVLKTIVLGTLRLDSLTEVNK